MCAFLWNRDPNQYCNTDKNSDDTIHHTAYDHIYAFCISFVDTICTNSYAAKAVIVTKDEDFVASTLCGETVTVVWLRVGNVRNRILLARIEAG